MRTSSKFRILLGSSASVVAALTAVSILPSTASAAGTTVRGGSITGPAYAGRFQAQLLGEGVVSTWIGSGSCNKATMTGTIEADNNELKADTATFNKDNGPCASGDITIAITAEDLPWKGAVTHSPVTGGRDGTVTFTNIKIKADASLFNGVTCYYGGKLTFESFNPTNPARPVPSVNQMQIRVVNATARKVGGNILCPVTAKVTATYQLSGEADRAFTLPLHITG